jgi:hypothetical protein
MRGIRRLAKYPMCMIGMHQAPRQRHPNGPIVATCPCCGKTCYFYGLTAYGLGGPPILTPIAVKPPTQIPR